MTIKHILSENCLLLKFLSQTQKNVSEPQTGPGSSMVRAAASHLHIYIYYRVDR